MSLCRREEKLEKARNVGESDAGEGGLELRRRLKSLEQNLKLGNAKHGMAGE